MWWASRIVVALNLRSTLPLSPIFIPLCNSHIQSLKLNCHSSISICAFLATASALPSTTKPLIHTAIYLHYDSSHPRHCKESLPYSQLLRLRHICSDQADFLNKAQEMASFFRDADTAHKLYNMTSTTWSTCLKATPLPKAIQWRKRWEGFLWYSHTILWTLEYNESCLTISKWLQTIQ